MKWTVIDSDATEQENSQQQSAVKKDELKQNQKKNQKKKQKRKRSDDCKYLELGELDGLNWQNIPYSESTPFTDEAAGGYTALEEIDDVEVLYEKNPGGNIVKFRKLNTVVEKLGVKEDKSICDEESSNITQLSSSQFRVKSIVTPPKVEELANAEMDMSAWDEFGLDNAILQALRHSGFQKPTEIQAKTLPVALQQHRDILGAAETGSGKTLAFALPILQLLLQQDTVEEPSALILTPTRELAIQVRDHIDRLCTVATKIRTIAIVGGMSVENQQRLLGRKPAVIVATPGRLWELIKDGEPYLSRLRQSLRFLVLDEADRMLEKGHFKDLGNLMDYLNNFNCLEDCENDAGGKNNNNTAGKPKRQTFVFSATLTRHFAIQQQRKDEDQDNQAFYALAKMINFREKRPCLIDLTTTQVMAQSLVENRVDCLQTEKDVYLYYFLSRFPGRTIVFVNSISCIRRLVPLVALLGFQVFGLHAQMQQRQRLKNLDRFKNQPESVLIASDVAARGLDIPLVDHVVHYQLPRTVDLYIHRSGRTARRQHSGISVLICCPEELKSYKMICKTLGKESGLPLFPVERLLIKPLMERVKLAIEIDKFEYRNRRKGHDSGWISKAAKEMDMGSSDGEDSCDNSAKNSQEERRITAMRGHLKQLLSKPLLPTGSSTRYITSSMVENLPAKLIDNLYGTKGVRRFPGSEKKKAVETAGK